MNEINIEDTIDEVDITNISSEDNLNLNSNSNSNTYTNSNSNSKNSSSLSRNRSKLEIDPNHVNYELPTTEQFYFVLLSLLISMAVSSLDVIILAAALPTISAEFNSHDNYTLIIAAYLLANASILPICGKLADIFGRRAVMLCGLSIFLVSSIVCGASRSFIMIILARSLQGLGSGCLCVMSNVICTDIVSVRERPTYLGLLNSTFSLSLIIGPLIGGLFIDGISWRWAFYINVPLCLIAIIGIGLYVKIPTPEGSLMNKVERIDFVGTYFFIVTTICLLLVSNWGGIIYNWSSPVILGLIGSFLVLLTCFIVVEYKLTREPIIPLHLFQERNIALCIIISFFTGFISITFNNTFSMLYQDGRNFSVVIAGLRITPLFITTTVSSIFWDRIARKYGYIKEFAVIGSFLFIVSCFCLSLIGTDTRYYVEFLIYLFYGICISIPTQFSLLISQISAPIKLKNIATSVTLFFNLIGGIVGICVFGMVFKNVFKYVYEDDYPNIDVTINDFKELDEGQYYYVKAINITYRSMFLPASVIVLFSSLLLRRLKYINKIRKSSSLRRNYNNHPIDIEEMNI